MMQGTISGTKPSGPEPAPTPLPKKVLRFMVFNRLRFSDNYYGREFYLSQHPVSACEHHPSNKNLSNISYHKKATPNNCFITHSAQNILKLLSHPNLSRIK